MRAWQTPQLVRYLADRRRAPEDVQAPDRPSSEHEWIDSAGWMVPADARDKRAALEVDGMTRMLFEINFNQENRLRALEGKLPVSRAAYRQALIDFWKSINP